MIWEIEKLTNDCHDRLMIFYHGHMTYDVDKILLFLYYVKWNDHSRIAPNKRLPGREICLLWIESKHIYQG